jgi:hypothetical protein
MKLPSTNTILITLHSLLATRVSLNVTLVIPTKDRVKDMLLLEALIKVPLNINLAIPVKGRVEDMLILEASIKVPLNINLAIPAKGTVEDMPVFVLVIPSERQPLSPKSHPGHTSSP